MSINNTNSRRRARASRAVDATPTLSRETIHWPGRDELDPADTVVRPALTVLFRLAVGSSSDYYIPRFLAYERLGRPRPGWHWPALLFPPVWAFYRRLWGAGVCYALLPLLGALVFAFIAPRYEDSMTSWFACAALLIWVLPNVTSALVANSLLYRRVRKLVHRAESESRGPSQAASWFGGRRPTSIIAAFLCGGIVVGMLLGALVSQVHIAYTERVARAKLAQSLAAVRLIELRVEEAWLRGVPFTRIVDDNSVIVPQGATLLADVKLRAADGRLRLDLDHSLPELAGKVILLAPTLDLADRVRWFCVPVDIPERFLPAACRGPAFQSNALREIQERLIAWLTVARDMIARVAGHLTL